MEMVRQVELRSPSGDGELVMVCWLGADKRIKVGNCIRLKDSEDKDRWWTISQVYDVIDKIYLHNDFLNNVSRDSKGIYR